MSKSAIEGLQPKLLWESFYGIAQVPRPSKKEEQIREHVKQFARNHNFSYKEDKTGNIVISVPASSGYENSPGIVIQGHMDMVCEKNKGTSHNFDTDPIELVRDGEWMKANGTTLGSDNGIGLAAGMALALDAEAIHGPLELLCTVDEETGLTGANNLEPGFITGQILLNLDSEEDGTFYVGCAGGQDTIGYLEPQFIEAPKGYDVYELMVTGLKGGHSGLDIHAGRANAIKLLARLLYNLSNVELRIAGISGGSLRNAIPREAEVALVLNKNEADIVERLINEYSGEILQEYGTNDGDFKVKFEKIQKSAQQIFNTEFAKNLIHLLLVIPHGIMAMSPDIPDLVETSTNLATIGDSKGKLRIGTSQRSSIESAKKALSQSVCAAFFMGGAEDVETTDGYPGWKPNLDSRILKEGKSVYKELFENEPQVKAIHAGLECGILGEKYPGLDMLSFGPTIQGAHSPDERINIKDVEKFYLLLKGIARKLA